MSAKGLGSGTSQPPGPLHLHQRTLSAQSLRSVSCQKRNKRHLDTEARPWIALALAERMVRFDSR